MPSGLEDDLAPAQLVAPRARLDTLWREEEVFKGRLEDETSAPAQFVSPMLRLDLLYLPDEWFKGRIEDERPPPQQFVAPSLRIDPANLPDEFFRGRIEDEARPPEQSLTPRIRLDLLSLPDEVFVGKLEDETLGPAQVYAQRLRLDPELVDDEFVAVTSVPDEDGLLWQPATPKTVLGALAETDEVGWAPIEDDPITVMRLWVAQVPGTSANDEEVVLATAIDDDTMVVAVPPPPRARMAPAFDEETNTAFDEDWCLSGASPASRVAAPLLLEDERAEPIEEEVVLLAPLAARPLLTSPATDAESVAPLEDDQAPLPQVFQRTAPSVLIAAEDDARVSPFEDEGVLSPTPQAHPSVLALPEEGDPSIVIVDDDVPARPVLWVSAPQATAVVQDEELVTGIDEDTPVSQFRLENQRVWILSPDSEGPASVIDDETFAPPQRRDVNPAAFFQQPWFNEDPSTQAITDETFAPPQRRLPNPAAYFQKPWWHEDPDPPPPPPPSPEPLGGRGSTFRVGEPPILCDPPTAPIVDTTTRVQALFELDLEQRAIVVREPVQADLERASGAERERLRLEMELSVRFVAVSIVRGPDEQLYVKPALPDDVHVPLEQWVSEREAIEIAREPEGRVAPPAGWFPERSWFPEGRPATAPASAPAPAAAAVATDTRMASAMQYRPASTGKWVAAGVGLGSVVATIWVLWPSPR